MITDATDRQATSDQRHGPEAPPARRRGRPVLAAAVAVLALGVGTGCGADDDREQARVPGTTEQVVTYVTSTPTVTAAPAADAQPAPAADAASAPPTVTGSSVSTPETIDGSTPSSTDVSKRAPASCYGLADNQKCRR